MAPVITVRGTPAPYSSVAVGSPDSERRQNAAFTKLVDVGIEAYDTGNWNAAREFFANHRVPSTTVVRVLFHRVQRRGRKQPTNA